MHVSKMTMTVVLDFIYKRTLPLNAGNALEHLVPAHSLQIAGLSPKCLDLIKLMVNLDNVVAMADNADQCCSSELRDMALNVVLKQVALPVPLLVR